MTRNKTILAVLVISFFITLIGCESNSEKPSVEAVTLQSFGEHIVVAIGDDYTDAMNELGIDSSQVTFDDSNRGKAGELIDIMDHSYQPFIFTDQDKLTTIILRAEIDNDADALQSIQSLVDKMNTLYGTPSTYPELPNRLVDYVENPETASNRPEGYAETWSIKDNTVEDTDIVLEAKLSLLTPIEDDPNRLNYVIEISYQYKFIGYRPAS